MTEPAFACWKIFTRKLKRAIGFAILKGGNCENEIFAIPGSSLDLGPASSARRVVTEQCTLSPDFRRRANREYTMKTRQLQGRVARSRPCSTGEFPAEREDCGHGASHVEVPSSGTSIQSRDIQATGWQC